LTNAAQTSETTNEEIGACGWISAIDSNKRDELPFLEALFPHRDGSEVGLVLKFNYQFFCSIARSDSYSISAMLVALPPVQNAKALSIQITAIILNSGAVGKLPSGFCVCL
jgi:hypothetical protein